MINHKNIWCILVKLKEKQTTFSESIGSHRQPTLKWIWDIINIICQCPDKTNLHKHFVSTLNYESLK